MITPFEFLIVSLVVFRVTRFFVHDSLIGSSLDSGSSFSRSLDTWAYDSKGKDKSWLRGKIHDLITCPYCLGFWFSLVAVCIFERTRPWDFGINGWFIVWAVSGASALIYQAKLKMMR